MTRSHALSPDSAARQGYAGLFGTPGTTLSVEDWITRANRSLPPNLSALNAQFVSGSRTEKTLKVSYDLRPESFSFFSLSGGVTAEMLDQAATHCATMITGYGCPTLTMTTHYFRRGKGSRFVASTRIFSMTSVTATITAELTDERDERIAAACVIVQFIKDVTPFTAAAQPQG